ncbi:MAG: hypothetical protein K0R65_2841 [Crocinitomicaceae bacterium]|jgi:hypothetical protein|nr:hypothetical protein [Crocinitomicaceae bacterium]
MKTHSTNYQNTFIAVAEDCPATHAETPPQKGTDKSVANIQFEMISQNPYKYTSDDVVFQCFALKKDLTENELEEGRKAFFSKGQPCLRCSPLTKRYGFGVHSDAEGKVALYPMESEEYEAFSKDPKLQVVKAMRSKKA